MEFFKNRDKQFDKGIKQSKQEIDGGNINGVNCDSKKAIVSEYKGGSKALQLYIIDNVHYPQESIEKNEQGKVYLSFIIEKNGTPSHVQVERGVSQLLDREATLLIYFMPRWIPATCDGEPIRSIARMPIYFTLN